MRANPRSRLAALLGEQAHVDGMTRCARGVSLYRRSQPGGRVPVCYEPSVIIVAQGRKRGFLGEAVYSYDPENFLVLGVPLPIESEVVDASEDEPLLSLKVPVDTALVRELLLALGEHGPGPGPEGSMHTGRVDDALRESAIRLLEALRDPLDREVLLPLCVREILYRVLRSERGHLLRDLVAQGSHFRRIARVLRHLHAESPEPLDVPAMAKLARLGTSTFHEAFKAATALTPIQYLKRVRLHRARAHLLEGDLTVSEVAYRVGYNSPSQFSREFKRMFGRPPAAEAERLRAAGEVLS